VTTLHDFGGVLGRPLDTFFNFKLSQCHGHGSWLVCEVALNLTKFPKDHLLITGLTQLPFRKEEDKPKRLYNGISQLTPNITTVVLSTIVR
jgi:hypothetical protein